jgi:hypothetical protein
VGGNFSNRLSRGVFLARRASRMTWIRIHRLELQEEARSTERQKRLVADTDKLLALATDLKEQVDKTNKNILSIDVIKKADEIEKLAHSVKERMKG